jgi:hypothetical protein
MILNENFDALELGGFFWIPKKPEPLKRRNRNQGGESYFFTENTSAVFYNAHLLLMKANDFQNFIFLL